VTRAARCINGVLRIEGLREVPWGSINGKESQKGSNRAARLSEGGNMRPGRPARRQRGSCPAACSSHDPFPRACEESEKVHGSFVERRSVQMRISSSDVKDKESPSFGAETNPELRLKCGLELV